MKLLGLSCFYHDAAAALVVDGVLTAAALEERFSRVKHDQGFPCRAAEFCLERGGLKVNELDHIVFYDKPLTKFDRIVTGYLATPVRSYRAFLEAMSVWLGRKLWTDHVIGTELGYDGEILYVPHHISHAAGAFYGSPFDKAAILTVDGVGEWATASYGTGDNNRVRLLAEMHYPHSVGLFYSAMTHFLGFRVNSAEYKVMGLAPYGEPRYADLLEENLVHIHEDGSIHLNMEYFTFHHKLAMTGHKLETLLGCPRRSPESEILSFHRDIAASTQAVAEKIVLRMAHHVREVTGLSRLCMSGGVALNCKANGLLLREGMFDEIYIQPASGDAGGAVGAALYAYHRLTGDDKHPQRFFGLGPEYSDDQIEAFLTRHRIPFAHDDIEIQLARLARELTEGKIVALFQGGEEFGPRALGFRSIVADPRNPQMKEKINSAVKFRESFRPFAPAVLKENAAEYFDCESDSPYMLFNFTVRKNKRRLIPAVTHIDGSARIQTVARSDNPVFYDLIAEFNRLTGVPVLLNTSFNLRGHPIVSRPEDAMAIFCSSGIDFLLMSRYLVDRCRVSESVSSRFTLENGYD
ncbi:MAG: hypothetical protein KAU35_05085 [candidate division Zixibacteria bacterium]|nr:hypothetical protein [candidate division Zixibacteria bacterium]